MKKIKTQSYIKKAQAPNNGETFEIQRNWDAYEGWYNSVEEFPTKMPFNGISTINVVASYTIDNNIGFGENPDISINVLRITDESQKDLSQFELMDSEIQEIKKVILENVESNDNLRYDTREEKEGLR